MNVQPNDQKRRTGAPEESPFTISTANLVTVGKPIGTFAASEDFIIRIRNGKLVTADTGDQGGRSKLENTVDQFLRRYGGAQPKRELSRKALRKRYGKRLGEFDHSSLA
jgi:hypothetical protein